MPGYSLRLFATVCGLFLLFGAVDGEDFTIFRGDVNRGTDRFLVPKSLCKKLNVSGTRDVCGHYFGTITTFKQSVCDCLCPKNRSTFIYHNYEWSCLPNDILRYRQGCKYFFKDDTQKDPLKILDNGNKVFLNLSTTQRCGLHLNASRYELCGKEWKPVIKDGKTPKRFSLVQDGPSYQLQIKNDSGATYLNRQIIKLMIKCTEERLEPTESCLLLKLRGGATKCSAATPTDMTSLLPTMVCPSPTSSLSLSPTPSLSKAKGTLSTWSKVHSTKFVSATIVKPSQEMSSSIVVVNPGGKDERRGSVATAVIVGPIVAGLVFIIVVSGAFAFVYHRRKKRNSNSTRSISSTGLITEKQQTIPLNPMLDDALYLQPSDVGIQNSNPKTRVSNRSISNPVYERGNDQSIKVKVHAPVYSLPNKRVPPQPQHKSESRSEEPGNENQGYLSEEDVYSEAWVPGTPRKISIDVSSEQPIKFDVPTTSDDVYSEAWVPGTPRSISIEQPASPTKFGVPTSSDDLDYKTPNQVSDNEESPRPFYAILEDSEPSKPLDITGANNDSTIQDETQTPVSFYDDVEATISPGASDDAYEGPLVSPNPLYEDSRFFQGDVHRESNCPLYNVLEEPETQGSIDELQEAPEYDTAERPIYEPVRNEGPRRSGPGEETLGYFSAQELGLDSERRSDENQESDPVYQDLLQRGETVPEVSYQTLERPKPKARKKTTPKNS